MHPACLEMIMNKQAGYTAPTSDGTSCTTRLFCLLTGFDLEFFWPLFDKSGLDI